MIYDFNIGNYSIILYSFKQYDTTFQVITFSSFKIIEMLEQYRYLLLKIELLLNTIA